MAKVKTPLLIEMTAYSENLKFVWNGAGETIHVFNKNHDSAHDFIDAEVETLDQFVDAIHEWLATPEDLSDIR